jgi:hypothetical protein
MHAAPVPDDGNCTDTLGHLDPYIRGETPACDSDLPQTCQVGDLSGKHGMIESDPFTASYMDEFASTAEGIGAFFGNRSFVVHFANKTRITCANFQLLGGGSPSSMDMDPSTSLNTTATSKNGTTNGTSTSGVTMFTGKASTNSVAISAVSAVGVVAVFLLAL